MCQLLLKVMLYAFLYFVALCHIFLLVFKMCENEIYNLHFTC